MRVKLKQMLFHNLGLKLFSLLVAVSLYSYTQSARDVTFSVSVKLALDAPSGLMVISDVPPEVIVAVKGGWSAMRGFQGEDVLPLRVDLAGFSAGTSTYYLSSDMIKLPPGLEVVSLNPSALTITLDPVVEKRVKVVANLRGQPAKGYRIGGYEVEPNEILLRGPRRFLEPLDFVMARPVDVTDQMQSLRQAVSLQIEPKGVEPAEQRLVRVSVDIEEVIDSRAYTNIPVRLRTHGSLLAHEGLKFNLTPARVGATFRGPVRLLDLMEPGSGGLEGEIDLAFEADEPPQQGKVTHQVSFPSLPDKVVLVGRPPNVVVEISKDPELTKELERQRRSNSGSQPQPGGPAVP